MQNQPKILDVGCGTAKHTGAIGIDVNPRSCADVIHDLNVIPYPFGESEFDVIFCMDVLEHLADVVKTMNELWRIGKPGCKVFIRVPFFASADSHIDPTHLRGFTHRSLDYFIEHSTFFKKYRYSDVTFRMVSWDYDPDEQSKRSLLFRLMHWFAKRHPLLYEARLANLYPFSFIQFDLEVIKRPLRPASPTN